LTGRGNDQDNIIIGNVGVSNRLYGHDGDDNVQGGNWNDLLVGGAGSDTLDGGSGRDTFMFDYQATLGAGIDRIKNFSVAEDSIQMNSELYTSLNLGGEALISPLLINPDFFKVGSQATDGNDFLIYNNLTGALSYDEDAYGLGAASIIAVLDPGLNLSAANFFII
jgi:serralysin